MDKIKIRFDPSSNSLTVWFDDPREMAYLSPIEDEAGVGGDLHLIKNEAGEVIGFECLFYSVPSGELAVEFETLRLNALQSLR